MTDTAAPARRRARWYSPRSIWRSFALRPRVIAATAVTVVALLVLPSSFHAAVREATAWCIGGSTYLLMAFSIMRGCQAGELRRRAARQDDSAVVILVLILVAMFSSFAAIVGLLGAAKAAAGEGRLVFVGLAGATILVSWTVTQVAFTLHYAHEYYALDTAAGSGDQHTPPLTFPGGGQPDYWDFFYFATSFGAASQTSDVMINAKSIRRLATLHAIVSFFFNTMVLALTINLAASLAT